MAGFADLRVWAASSCLVLTAACSLLGVSAAQASPVSPLPVSDYSTQPACAAPAPGHVACLAEILEPRTAAARARTHPLGITTSHALVHGSASEGADGLRPQDLRDAYFPGEEPDAPASEPQTLAIVDAYNDPEAETDLRVYDEEFHLPECTTANGCFQQLNQNGETGKPPFPASAQAKAEKEALCESATAGPSVAKAACRLIEEVDGWSLEISLDIQTAHAVCQNCRIVLLEAEGEQAALETAEDTAVRLGAGEVSNSWAGSEPMTDSEAFNHPGVVITFAAGDRGYLNWGRDKLEEELEGETADVNYPASSPHVIAIGGTTLKLNSVTGAWSEESVWGGSGGGCSLNFSAQPWQTEVADWSSVGCEDRRAVNDVSADANPYTGVAVYDSAPYIPLGGGLKSAHVFDWTPIGGTSASTPMIAAMFALAGGSHGVAYPAQTLYSHLGSASLHDITEGSTGECFGDYSSSCSGSMSPVSLTDCGQGALICNSAVGYDGPTGVGTPDGLAALEPTPRHKGGGPEAPLTEACAGALFTSTGIVCGTLNPAIASTAGYYFAYNKGTNCIAGKKTPLEPEKAGKAIQVSGELFGLEADAEYSYCLIATDSSGETIGQTLRFTTEPAAPRPPQTRDATSIGTATATLNGRLRAEPIKTGWYFEYAPGYECAATGAQVTPEREDTTLGEPDEVSAPVAGLEPGTEYAVCLVAKNRIGTTTGSIAWFVTESAPPTVEAVSAQSTATEVTFAATVDPNAQEATCEFRYGTSESYGSEVPCREGLGTSGNHVNASAQVTGLKPETTYYFQVVAKNQAGESLTSEGRGTFTTQPTSTPNEPPGEEKPPTPPPTSPIVATITPVTIPTTPLTPATPSTGGVALAATAIKVRGGDVSFVELECLGLASCRGKLTLTARVLDNRGKSTGKGKKATVRAATVAMATIGTVSFSIAGDETKTVKVDLNAAGRALLNADHGRVDASLQILELAPGPGNTQTKAVRLLQQQAIRPR